MPLYEYRCQDCDRIFEQLRSMNDADKPVECTYCKSLKTNKVLSLFSAQSAGKSISGTGSSCGSCSGGNCGCCKH